MHEASLHNCLLGCASEPDSQSHYMQCPHLFALIRYLIRDVSGDPLTRWGLVNPTLRSMHCACCAFSGYHAVKAQIRASSTHFVNTNDGPCCGSLIRSHWIVFADAFRQMQVNLAYLARHTLSPVFVCFFCKAAV